MSVSTARPRRLEVGRSIDGSRSVVLVESRFEWTAAVADAAVLLDTRRARAHQVVVIVGVALTTPTDSPSNDGETSQDDSTADAHDHANDDLLLAGAQTRISRSTVAVVEAGSRTGGRGWSGADGHRGAGREETRGGLAALSHYGRDHDRSHRR